MDESAWDKRISHIFHECLDSQAGKEYLSPPLPRSMLFLRVCHSPNFVLTPQQHWQHWLGGGGLKTLAIVPRLSTNFVKCLNSFIDDCSLFKIVPFSVASARFEFNNEKGIKSWAREFSLMFLWWKTRKIINDDSNILKVGVSFPDQEI